MVMLKLGNNGAQVQKLQVLLNAQLLPGHRLREDGDFGRKTHEAVERFQRTKGLKPDGMVGPVTRTALGRRTSVAPGKMIVPTLASWMQIAELELGIHEVLRPGHHNQRIIVYHKMTILKATDDETPWCSSFVNWVMIKSGCKGTNSAAAKSWLVWGQSLGAPREGAITVIKEKSQGSDAATGSSTGFHVGFYAGSSPTHI